MLKIVPSLTAALLASAAAPAFAQTTMGNYVPPKLVKQGTAPSAAPAGAVTVKVLVKKDGTVGSVQVVKSTNRGDNDAALAIARSSSYVPGTLNGNAEDAYYTLALHFTGGGSVSADLPGASGALAQADALLRAGKYDEAKSQAESYLVSHPGDERANVLLGVADEELKDSAGAAAAFDRVATVPETFRSVAATAYDEAAAAATKGGDQYKAAQDADKAIGLEPDSANGYYVRGVARVNTKEFAGGIADLQKARQLAQNGSGGPQADAVIREALANAYVSQGNIAGNAAKNAADWQSVKAYADQAAAVDPADANAAYLQGVALAKMGKPADGLSALKHAKDLAAPGSPIAGQIDEAIAALTKAGQKKTDAM